MPLSKFLGEVLRMIARNRLKVAFSLVVLCGLIAWIVCCGGGSSSSSSGPGSGPTPSPTPTPSHSVAISWQASTSPEVGSYNVYRSTTSGGPYTTRVGWRVMGTTFTDTAVQPGATYFYVVTSVTTSNVESTISSEIKATVPTP
jgi:hypothetical protein